MNALYKNVQNAKLKSQIVFKNANKTRLKPHSIKTFNHNIRSVINKNYDDYSMQQKRVIFNSLKLKPCKYNDHLDSMFMFGSNRILKKLTKKKPVLHCRKYNNIHIYHFSDCSNFVLDNVGKRIMMIQHLFNKEDQEVHLYLFLTNCEKRFDFSKNVISPAMVNSAVTTFFQNGNSHVIIMRKEELPKVLIHEMIHLFNIDKEPKSEVTDYIQRRFPVKNLNGNMLYNEAWTETLATLINCAYLAKTEKQFRKMVNLEKEYGLVQSNKILNGFQTNSENFNRGFTPEIRETTAATSYNIIKAMHLQNANVFLRNLNNNGGLIKQLEKSRIKKRVVLPNNSAKMTFYGSHYQLR